MINRFLLYLSLFTRIPVGKRVKYSEEDIFRGTYFFPIVGIITGLILYLATFILPPLGNAKSLGIVVLYVAITGGIHIDGLADSSDAIFSGRKGEKAFEILKDSRIGTFGALSMILVIIAYIVSMSRIQEPMYVFFFPVVGKLCGSIGAYISAPAKEDGMGTMFINGSSALPIILYFALLGPTIFLTMGYIGIFSLIIAIIMTGYLHLKSYHVFGGQTGDTIGMTVELAQASFLFTSLCMNSI